MKLWRSTLWATVFVETYGKLSEKASSSCQSKETLGWKNEIKMWKTDEESEFSRHF